MFTITHTCIDLLLQSVPMHQASITKGLSGIERFIRREAVRLFNGGDKNSSRREAVDDLMHRINTDEDFIKRTSVIVEIESLRHKLANVESKGYEVIGVGIENPDNVFVTGDNELVQVLYQKLPVQTQGSVLPHPVVAMCIPGLEKLETVTEGSKLILKSNYAIKFIVEVDVIQNNVYIDVTML